MNNVKNFLASATLLVISSSISAWNSEEIKISKKIGDYPYQSFAVPHDSDEKSISVTVRYCSELEAESQLKEFAVGHILKKCDGCYAAGISNMPVMHFDDIYKSYKHAMTSKRDSVCALQDEIALHFPRYETHGIIWMKIMREYKHSGIILIATDKEKNETQKVLNMYKTIFKKIAEEESGVTYAETKYENGKVIEHTSSWAQWTSNYNLWSKFKNLVWNEKFLYTMAGLSALYLGYEYLNQ